MDFLEQNNLVVHPLAGNFDSSYEKFLLPRKTIKLLTYNIFERPMVKNNESDWKEERIEEFKKCFKDFDIICFQEMFSSLNTRRDDMEKNATDAGFFFYSEVPPPQFFSKSIVDGGLLTISRFPIYETVFHPFIYTVLSDHISQKGVQYNKIQIKDSYLHLFSTHMQASYYGSSEDERKLSFEARHEHILAAHDIIDDFIGEFRKEDTILICGDFNVNSYRGTKEENDAKSREERIETEEYALLVELLNKSDFIVEDVFEKAHGFHEVTYGKDAGELQHKYDRVLIFPEDIKSKQSLDYIFQIFIDQDDYDNKDRYKKLKVDYSTVKVEEFLVDNPNFQQLSDHFGMSVEIYYDESMN